MFVRGFPCYYFSIGQYTNYKEDYVAIYVAYVRIKQSENIITCIIFEFGCIGTRGKHVRPTKYIHNYVYLYV